MRKIPVALMCLLGSSVLTPSSAQNAPKFPPPIKGEYGCIQVGVGVGTSVTADPGGVASGFHSGGLTFNYAAPQVQAQPSVLGKLVLDGKGNYTVTGLKARGTYKFDPKTNRLSYTGALAKLEQPGYLVSSKGTFSLSFDLGGARNYCEVRVKGNPLPAVKNPNGPLSGTLVLSNQNGADERRAADGKYLEGVKAPLGARDARGRFVYILLKGTGHNELVLEDSVGKKLGGFNFSGYGILDGRNSYPTLSPDGKKVALFLLGKIDYDKGIYTAPDLLAITDLSGENTQILSSTDNIKYNTGPAAWTPDGRVLYSGKDDRLYISDAGFAKEKRITEREGRFPAVSPDGKKVAYISGNALYTMNLDGTGVKKIEQGEKANIFLSSPAWSPDGKFLASLISDDSYHTNVWLNPLESGKKGYGLTDEYGQTVDVYGIVRLSWWSGK